MLLEDISCSICIYSASCQYRVMYHGDYLCRSREVEVTDKATAIQQRSYTRTCKKSPCTTTHVQCLEKCHVNRISCSSHLSTCQAERSSEQRRSCSVSAVTVTHAGNSGSDTHRNWICRIIPY